MTCKLTVLFYATCLQCTKRHPTFFMVAEKAILTYPNLNSPRYMDIANGLNLQGIINSNLIHLKVLTILSFFKTFFFPHQTLPLNGHNKRNAQNGLVKILPSLTYATRNKIPLLEQSLDMPILTSNSQIHHNEIPAQNIANA